MQNKPNFRKADMTLTPYSTKDYGNEPRLKTPGKQTQTNPIYRGEACLPRPSPIRSRIKPNLSRRSLPAAAKSHTKPDQTQPVAAKPPCRGEVLHEAGMAKPDQTQKCPPAPSGGRRRSEKLIRLRRIKMQSAKLPNPPLRLRSGRAEGALEFNY